MTPMLTFSRPVMSEPWAPDVVHFIVAEGKFCSLDCPNLRADGFCKAFKINLTRDSIVSTHRCATCIASASNSSLSKASVAFNRLNELRARKGQMKQETKSEQPKTKDKKRPADVRIQKDTRHLKIALTREEIEERAERAAYTWAEMQKQEAEMKAVASTFKARISELEGKLNALQQQVRDRCAYGDVDCDIVFDFKVKEVYVVRLDTKDEIERRDMRRDEMQEKFEFKDTDQPKDEAVAELNEEGDRTASELKARAKKSKRNA